MFRPVNWGSLHTPLENRARSSVKLSGSTWCHSPAATPRERQ
jgi:hypothetical protein